MTGRLAEKTCLVTAAGQGIGRATALRKMSRKRLAELMGTSRTQINRLLNPSDGNVTLTTLQRAAEMLGRKVRL